MNEIIDLAKIANYMKPHCCNILENPQKFGSTHNFQSDTGIGADITVGSGIC